MRRAHSSTAVLFGATSQIGIDVVRELVVPGVRSRLVLAGRSGAHRAAAAEELREDYTVSELDWDALDLEDATWVMDQAAGRAGRPVDLVVIAVGTLPPGLPDLTQRSAAAELRDALSVNAVAPATLLVAAVQRLASDGGGQVVLLSSASAVRPRRQILTYALAKQSADAMARHVQPAARALGVDIHVVRPGHVLTPMTQGLPVPPLARTSAQVARDVATGVAHRRGVIWSPAVMRSVVWGLRLVPRSLLPGSLR
ncbi:MAG TPA: SDR family NAD(P)-dependent oxidoreductase [Marmoricola sp.]|nr:SDR family NAD(P)-dependent oxidoreductase [Marmoricola sp.]